MHEMNTYFTRLKRDSAKCVFNYIQFDEAPTT